MRSSAAALKDRLLALRPGADGQGRSKVKSVFLCLALRCCPRCFTP